MGLALLLVNGSRIFVYPKDDHAPATFTILNFPIDDLEGVNDAFTRAGVRLEIYDLPGFKTGERGVFTGEGMKVAWFKDPAGNDLSIIQED